MQVYIVIVSDWSYQDCGCSDTEILAVYDSEEKAKDRIEHERLMHASGKRYHSPDFQINEQQVLVS